MALISIRKFLNVPDAATDGANDPAACQGHGCTRVCSDLHSLILRHAYPAESLGSAPDDLALASARTSSEHRDELLRELAANLQARRIQDQQRCQRNAQELHNLFSILNSALTSLARGSETSVAHLKQVEVQLSRASMMEDLSSLKDTLNNTVVLLRQESQRRQRESAEELRSFEEAYQRAKQSSSAALNTTAGREAALEVLRRQSVIDQPPLVVLACVFERLRMLESRFGESAAEDLVRNFTREVVNTASPSPDVYQWTRDMLVWLVRSPLPAAETRAFWEARLRQPFEFRTLAGGRSVLLSVNCRWMFASIPPDQPALLIEEIDRFTEGAKPRW